MENNLFLLPEPKLHQLINEDSLIDKGSNESNNQSNQLNNNMISNGVLFNKMHSSQNKDANTITMHLQETKKCTKNFKEDCYLRYFFNSKWPPQTSI